MRPFLRDEPDESTVRDVDALTDALVTASEAERLRLLGRRGDLLRILGRTDEAIRDLEEAHRTAVDASDLEPAVRQGIRLGTARFYAGDHERGERELRLSLAGAESLGDRVLLGFAHQHLGKCLAEQERLDEARVHFEHALLYRRATGDSALVGSSQRALDHLDDAG